MSRPWPVESAADLVTSSEGMSPAEGHDFAVGEAHSMPEHLAQMRHSLGGIGQASVRNSTASIGLVDAAEVEGDARTAEEFAGHATSDGVQVSVADLGVLHLDGMQPGGEELGAGKTMRSLSTIIHI